MAGWSAPLDGSGQTLEFTGVWSDPLDGSGQTLEDIGNPQWSAPLDGSGQTLIGFGIASATDYRPGTTCVLTVAGVGGTYSVEVNGGAVSVTDGLDVNGDGTVEFTAPRLVAYGTNVTIGLIMGGSSDSLDVPQLAETGLTYVNLGPIIPQHEAGLAVGIGDQVFVPHIGPSGAGRRYTATTAGTTGASTPTHGAESGVVSDGGVSWDFDAEWGRITANPDLESGFQLAAYDVQGGTVAGLTLNDDGTFDKVPDITSFLAIAFDGTSWGEPGLQQEPQLESGTAAAEVIVAATASGEKGGTGTAAASVVFGADASGFPGGVASGSAGVVFGATASGQKIGVGVVTAETVMVSSASGSTGRVLDRPVGSPMRAV